MSRPRRPGLVAVGVLALVAGVFGVWYWDATRFPAAERRLPGTPITLKIQDGLGVREVALFRRGLLMEQAFLADRIGRPIVAPLEARLAHGDPCEPFLDPGEGSTGMEREDFLCIDSLVPVWRRNARKRPVEAASASAHEVVHRWQRELGCNGPGDEFFVWLTEGNATDFAWRALVHAGMTTDAATARAIRRFGAFKDRVAPLRRYETQSGADPEYALWHLAVRDLLRHTPTGPVAMRRFCEAVGRGIPWRLAFRTAFGLPLERFYRTFEAARAAYRSGTRRL